MAVRILASILIGILGGLLITGGYCKILDPDGSSWCGIEFIYTFPLYIILSFAALFLFDKFVFRKTKLVLSKKLQNGILFAILILAFILFLLANMGVITLGFY